MNRAQKLIVLLMVALAAGAVAAQAPSCGVARGVTLTGIRSLRVGMPQEDVTRLLGEPLDVQASGPNAGLWMYARSRPLFPHSPDFWVEMRDGRVDSAGAVRAIGFLGLDEEAIFDLRAERSWEASVFAATFR